MRTYTSRADLSNQVVVQVIVRARAFEITVTVTDCEEPAADADARSGEVHASCCEVSWKKWVSRGKRDAREQEF